MGKKGEGTGGKGEGTGGKGGGNWEWGTPLSTPSKWFVIESKHRPTCSQTLGAKLSI